MGPHTFNFLEAAQQAESAGAALRVADMAAAVWQAERLVREAAARQRMSAAARAFSQAHSGAARRVAGRVQAML
jgi:3-deoxy-D-manno-octulosonic-acid transferase